MEMKKKKNMSSVIPSDIITYDILTRVPTESLVRFRCVCKNLSSLICHDSLFVKLHSQRNKNYTLSGLIRTNNDPACLVFMDHNDKKKRVMPITVAEGSVVVQDSFNGLLILRYAHLQNFRYHHTYYVYNAITNSSFMIPQPTESNYVCDFRLCYDPIMEKYKVVQVCASDPYESSIVKIRILSLGHRSGDKSYDDDYSWRDIVIQTPERYLRSDFGHIYLNGYLYWIIETKARIPADNLFFKKIVKNGSVKPYVLCLDTNRESFSKIRLPDKISSSACDYRNLNEMEGRLCVSEYFNITRELKIWKKEQEDEKKDEWMLMLKIDMRDSVGNVDVGLFNEIQIPAIVTVPKLKFIIKNTEPHGADTYFSYDVESKQLEIIYGPILYPNFVRWHVNSIPNW